ncbi:hypothetical protein KC19_2G260000 [Ceratodon purpureus]|uniref:Uncharacterized protein n=1 Tax=Ceratodon purpureus TaxID=3225 RepID=A0A8T0IZ74_CERPU|nr:hypothetical protein KC19_2G260000 [Ceratodon purpureus]
METLKLCNLLFPQSPATQRRKSQSQTLLKTPRHSTTTTKPPPSTTTTTIHHLIYSSQTTPNTTNTQNSNKSQTVAKLTYRQEKKDAAISEPKTQLPPHTPNAPKNHHNSNSTLNSQLQFLHHKIRLLHRLKTPTFLHHNSLFSCSNLLEPSRTLSKSLQLHSSSSIPASNCSNPPHKKIPHQKPKLESDPGPDNF